MQIFDTSYNWMILVFTMGVIFVLGVLIVGAYMYPIISSTHFVPDDEAKGMTTAQYHTNADFLYNGFSWVMYIFLAIPFVYITIKLLYEKEEVTVAG